MKKSKTTHSRDLIVRDLESIIGVLERLKKENISISVRLDMGIRYINNKIEKYEILNRGKK